MIFSASRKLNNSVVTNSSLCFCSQDETQHFPPHDGEEEEADLTGIRSCLRRADAEDGARAQNEVDQVGGVELDRRPDDDVYL